jgi:hypothetical protein
MTHETVTMTLSDGMEVVDFQHLAQRFISSESSEAYKDSKHTTALGNLILPNSGPWRKKDGNLYNFYKNASISIHEIRQALREMGRGRSEFTWEFELRYATSPSALADALSKIFLLPSRQGWVPVTPEDVVPEVDHQDTSIRFDLVDANVKAIKLAWQAAENSETSESEDETVTLNWHPGPLTAEELVKDGWVHLGVSPATLGVPATDEEDETEKPTIRFSLLDTYLELKRREQEKEDRRAARIEKAVRKQRKRDAESGDFETESRGIAVWTPKIGLKGFADQIDALNLTDHARAQAYMHIARALEFDSCIRSAKYFYDHDFRDSE